MKREKFLSLPMKVTVCVYMSVPSNNSEVNSQSAVLLTKKPPKFNKIIVDSRTNTF